jgi:Ca2+/Na+ antiporter
MIGYMKTHERYINEMLKKKLPAKKLQELGDCHQRQIKWMQHERMVHLLVMLFVCLFMLLSLGFAIINTSIPAIALCVLLLILSVAYIIHYYRLENRVQRWYLLAEKIKKRREK